MLNFAIYCFIIILSQKLNLQFSLNECKPYVDSIFTTRNHPVTKLT